jgi:hypothetical protein
MARQTYKVVRPVEHGETETDRRRYEPGQDIELEKPHAERLVKLGAIEHPNTAAAREQKRGAMSLEEIDRQLADLTARREALAKAAAPAPAAPPNDKGKTKAT